MRRYRIGMNLCIISVTAIFILLTVVYIFRLGKGRYDEDMHQWVRDWIPLTLPCYAAVGKSILLLISSRDPGIGSPNHDKKRRIHCHGDCSHRG